MITKGTFKSIESMLADKRIPNLRVNVHFTADGETVFSTYKDDFRKDYYTRATSSDFGQICRFWTGKRFVDKDPAPYLADEALEVLGDIQKNIKTLTKASSFDREIYISFKLNNNGDAEPIFHFSPIYDNELGLKSVVKYDHGEFVAAMNNLIATLPKAEKAA